MKKNPYLLPRRFMSVSTITEAIPDYSQIIAVFFQDYARQDFTEDWEEIGAFRLSAQQNINEQESDETSEEMDEDEEDEKLANVWLN